MLTPTLRLHVAVLRLLTPKGKRHDTQDFGVLSTRIERNVGEDSQQHHTAYIEIAVKRP